MKPSIIFMAKSNFSKCVKMPFITSMMTDFSLPSIVSAQKIDFNMEEVKLNGSLCGWQEMCQADQ